jgi:toxin ParE1/3/4
VTLRYAPRARRHLDAISEHLNERNPQAAQNVGRRIQETIELLTAFPRMGHQGSLIGTREIVVPGSPYIIVYSIEPDDEETLTILGVYHGAQRRPGQR